jgi:hypothetical protein
MKQHGIILAIGIFALIIIGMFTFAILKKNELETQTGVQSGDQTPPDPYSDVTRIDAKHFIIDGTHTIVGEIMLPTTCDLLNWDTVIRESMPEGVTVAFAVVNNAGNCGPATLPQRFVVTWKASANAQIDATFNGRPVVLNLIPALPGETPEDFELFLKG